MAESRKVVSIVFADVQGSTALGEQLDPEAMRRIMEGYFAEMRTVLERHGGTVEKFIGDAVMAVFGIPTVHEDDALRAVRAAVEMRERMDALNEGLRQKHGVGIAVRTGVNTGEVVAGDPAHGQAFVTGDAVNVAARLEETAQPGEIVLGPLTHELIADAVRADPIGPLELKGKTSPVQAWRLVEVLPDVPAYTRRVAATFVGRRQQLAELRSAYESARNSGSCELVTVTGAPGIGKSRLVHELVRVVGDEACVVVGRCLSYGEGITYWPLAEIVRQVAGRDSRSGLTELLGGWHDGAFATERLLGAIGASVEPARTEEIFWATRLLVERLAAERPLLIVVDDIHWGEPTFLDLIEYVAGAARAPVLIACTARVELFEARPQWPRQELIELEALPDDDAETLVEALLAETELSTDMRATITERAEGNPLFVEQMLALAGDNGADEITVPASIQALLGARLDHLPPEERAVLVRGAVEGRIFHRGAVSALLPEDERDSLPGRLLKLDRKQFIRMDEAVFAYDDAYSFVHVLLRDAAYDSAPKELRADLHQRFADWVEARTAHLDEIAGYHLEQSYRYWEALGERKRALGERAVERLAKASARASRRGDHAAAANLLGRAVELLPGDDERRLELALPLGDALAEAGRLEEAAQCFAEGARLGRDAGREALGILQEIELTRVRTQTDPSWSADEARSLAARALPLLGGDDAGLARVWRLAATAEFVQGKLAASEAASRQSLEHAERTGDLQLISDASTGIGAPSWYGHDSISELLPFHDRVHSWAHETGYRATEASMLFVKGRIAYEQFRFDDARLLISQSFALVDDLGLTTMRWGLSGQWTWGELQYEPEEVERRLTESYHALVTAGETGFLSTQAADLGLVLALRGALDEAEALTHESEQLGAPDDLTTQVAWRRSRAVILARRGRLPEGETLAREAVRRADAGEFAETSASAHIALAHVLRLADRPGEAAQELEQALAIYERKEFELSAAAIRAELAGLHAAVGLAGS